MIPSCNSLARSDENSLHSTSEPSKYMAENMFTLYIKLFIFYHSQIPAKNQSCLGHWVNISTLPYIYPQQIQDVGLAIKLRLLMNLLLSSIPWVLLQWKMH